MTQLHRIYHKRNELLEVEFYEDKECSIPFDFKKDVKNLYIELKDGDVSPLIALDGYIASNRCAYIPYLPAELYSNIYSLFDLTYFRCNITTLNDITPDLSKYIPEDNAVLFLSEEDCKQYKDCFPNNHIGLYINDGNNNETFIANNIESLISGIVEVKKSNATIFLQHGTQAKLEKAEEVAKELKEKYKVEKVNLFVKDWFLYRLSFDDYNINDILESWNLQNNFNKIITTNSTGILEPQNLEHLQVIDCFDIFQDYLNKNNN